MDTFTVAMTVLMAIIGLGNLVVSIAMLSASKRRAIKNCIAWRVDFFMVALLAVFGTRALVKFAFTAQPEKWDYYMMAAGAACLAMAYGTWLFVVISRYAYGVAIRVRKLESLALHPSEPSKEGSSG